MPENKDDIDLDRWTICDAVRQTRVNVLKLILQRRGRRDHKKLDDHWIDFECIEDLSGRTLLDHAINHPDGKPSKSTPPHLEIITLLLESGLRHRRHWYILRKMSACVADHFGVGGFRFRRYSPARPLKFSEIERICELVIESASDRESPVLRQFYQEQIKDKWEQSAHNRSLSENQHDIDLDGWDLERAAKENKVDIARALIARGDYVDGENENGVWRKTTPWMFRLTPLHWAGLYDSLEVAAFLIENGADLNARDISGNTPLHLALLKVTRLLIENGADVNVRDGFSGEIGTGNPHGSTPLSWIVANSDRKEFAVEKARLLIENGADVNVADMADRSPLHYGRGSNGVELTRLLIENGADINARDAEGKAPLHMAAYGNHYEVARLLIEYGAEVDARDDSEETPLHAAVDPSFVTSHEVARLLIEHGANTDGIDLSWMDDQEDA